MALSHGAKGQMKFTPRSNDDAKRLAKRALLAPGWHKARITEAVEKTSNG
jgi:hypothetical protein